MNLCGRCGQPNVGSGDICPDCLREQDQPTATFAPVGGPVVAPASTATSSGVLQLVVVKGPQMGDYFTLGAEPTTIGRNPRASIFLNDQTVSRDHAEILVSGDVVLLRDRGSLNGTYVNGLIVDEAEIRDGDVIQVGTFQLALRKGARAS
jgi:pSer/pThr/pTyr-binding forkhead associated (FHA) protein